MDGTLVQSEDCASQALIDVIPALTDSVQAVTMRYRGMRLAEIFDDIERQSPGAIPADCLQLYREREQALSASMIKPSPGADTLLSALSGSKCIASNAPVAKTRRSLEQCGLSHHFVHGVYSAYDVQAWKPDPTLFLHAAHDNQVDPKDCIVVEDSVVGLDASRAAGMRAVFYDPHGLTTTAEDTVRISALTQLLNLLNQA